VSDDEKPLRDRPSRASTMRPPPPALSAPLSPPRPAKISLRVESGKATRPTSPLPPVKIDVPPLPLVRVDALLPNDRPTPRSTVIPRLPAPLPAMRPPLETLIFHGAPPVPAPSPPKLPPLSPRPGRDEAFQDVHSAELLDDHDDDDDDGNHEEKDADERATESERPTPYHEAERALTDRPPPLSVPLRRTIPRSRELRVIAAIAAAIAIPVLVTIVVERPSPRPLVAVQARAEAPPGVAAKPPPRAPGSCAIDGVPHLLARRALVRGGVEATTLDERVAFATLTSTKSGTAFELDARTLAVKSSAKVVTGDPLHHIVPELGDDAPVEAQADTGALRSLADADGDSAIGLRDGFVVWGPRDGDGMVRLWKLPWPQALEAPRVAQLGTSGERVLVFRRAGAIWIGSFRGGQTTSDLTRLSAGDYVGVPALDARGDEAIVAWAQRDVAASPWGVRWVRWTAHGGQSLVHELSLPAGGPGDRAMAPSVSALDDRRFLLAWTEAGRGKNQVRAQVFDGTDHPLGDALTVSPQDAIAGQEQIALTDAGHGAIAYLVARRGAFELRATAIDCVR
jgi:hypothetical protein